MLFLSRLRTTLAVLLLALAASAMAQQGRDPRALIEAGRLELGQIEAALQREGLDDRRLGELRVRLEPLAEGVAELIAREVPRLEENKARLATLAPAPDASKSGAPEGADVARDRAEQQKLFQEAEETLRLARALHLRIEQAGQAIAERRRANFARQILAQGPSIVSPWLWFDVWRALPSDLKATRILLADWGRTVVANLDWHEMVMLGLFALLLALGGLRAMRWVQSGSLSKMTDPEVLEPTRPQKLLRALRRILLTTIVPTAVLFFLFLLLDRFELLPGRVKQLAEALAGAMALIAGLNGLATGIFMPKSPAWRLLPIGETASRQFWYILRQMGVVVGLGKIAEAMLSTIVASLPMSIALKGVVAVIVALRIASGLKRAFAHHQGTSEAERGVQGLLPLRFIAWVTVAAILVASLLGYVALASFLVDQVVWLVAIGLCVMLVGFLIDEVLGGGLSAEGILGRKVRAATGFGAASLDQASVLGSGIAKLVLFIAAAMLALAPWGIDSTSIFGNLKAAFFGFQVGGITISLSTIAGAIAFFVAGYLATRTIQNWLEHRYLPHTGLDVGLRASINAIFGYLGVFAAALLAAGQLGVSFEKITILAGALSVGIGFGLQSIANNFISGLILLWERPIRVGDWIVVGEEQGFVKRINVRATEIETFDKASLIIPNAEFITGRVKNWTHADRMARIIIPVSVDYGADPGAVQELLREAALAHREVLSEPKPFVIFKNLGESGLDFELRCYVDVDSLTLTRSELLFDIFRRLQEAKIGIPYPTRRLEIVGPAGGDAISAIAKVAG